MNALRKSKRFNCSIKAYFYAYGKKRSVTIDNFSQSGVFLKSDIILKSNTEIVLHFSSLNGYLHKIIYTVVRSQSEINLDSNKTYHRGMGLLLRDHKNPFNILASLSNAFSDHLKTSDKNERQKPHIIIFNHIFDYINLYHAQLTHLNLTFLNENLVLKNSIVNIIIRTKNQSFSTQFEAKVTKYVKDTHSKQYYIYCEIDQITLINLQLHIDDIMSKHQLYKNLSISDKGRILQQPLGKLVLNSIEKKYSGMLHLSNFSSQPIASFYFKDGNLLHVQTNSKQRLLKIILNAGSVSEKSKSLLLKQEISMSNPIEIRDYLIRKNIISAGLMFNLWKQYLLKNFRHLGNMLNINYRFIKRLPKEIVALNETLEIKNSTFALLNAYDDIFLKHFSGFATEKFFTIHKQKLYLWPQIILNHHNILDEHTIYDQSKLAETLSLSEKESRAFICYLSFIGELIIVD